MALSDPQGILATPLSIIDRNDEKQGLETILSLINQHQVGQIIVGLPHLMSGSLGEQAEKVRAFVDRLSSLTEVPVEFRDERLTTLAARRLMPAGSKRKKGKTRDDAFAAALILQSYLDEVCQQ